MPVSLGKEYCPRVARGCEICHPRERVVPNHEFITPHSRHVHEPIMTMWTEKHISKIEVDGLLPTAIFRRVYISYADRFVVLEPWYAESLTHRGQSHSIRVESLTDPPRQDA